MNTDKFLPIGTVVMLRGGKKRIMITGFCGSDKEHEDKIFDYAGCLYPEGMISSSQTLLFNHNQIGKIYYFGLRDEEEKQFKEKLNDFLAKNNIE